MLTALVFSAGVVAGTLCTLCIVAVMGRMDERHEAPDVEYL